MAIISGSGTYNYNTLTRTNDGASFEFNTNASVLFVDELPSGVILTATFDSPSNPAITLREKVQLRFKQTNRIIFTPSASTSGTIRIFLFLDESNVDEFDMSFYSTEVVGTSDSNITQIGSSTTPVTDLTNILDYSDAKTAERVLLVIDHATSGDTTVYTVATGKILMLHEGWHLAITGNSGFEAFANFSVQDSSSAVLYNFCFNFDKSAPTAELASTAFSFPVPLKVNAGEKIVASTSATNYTIKGGLYGTLIDV